MARRTKSAKTRGFRWGRALLLFSVLSLLLLVGGGAALYFAAKAYLRSDKFRLMLSGRASEVFKAEGEFELFSWTGSSVYSDKFIGQGYGDAAFSKVKAEGIEAEVDIGGVRRGVWAIPRVSIQRLNVLVDDQRLGGESLAAAVAKETDAAEGATVEELPDTRGFFQRLLPDKVAIDLVNVQELNFDFDPPEGDQIRGRGIALSVVPTDTEQVFKLDGSDGHIEIGVLPENLRTMEIDSFSLRTSTERVFLDEALLSFRDAEPGHVEISGDLTGGQPPVLALKARFREVPGDRVLPDDWVQRLKGNFSGELDIAGPGGSEIAGVIRLEDGSLEALPVLERIDQLAETKKFRRLLLTTLRTDIKRNGERLAIREFDIESAGIICAKGWLDYAAGSLTGGRYMLGITPDTIRWMPEWKKKIVEQVFRLDTASAFAGLFPANPDIETPPDGYRWTVIAVDPNSPEPYAADLRSQFVAAGGLALWAELEGLSEKAIGVATDLAKTATDQGINLLDVVTGAQQSRLFTEEGLEEIGENKEEQPGGRGLMDLPSTLLKTGFDTIDVLNPFATPKPRDGVREN